MLNPVLTQYLSIQRNYFNKSFVNFAPIGSMNPEKGHGNGEPMISDRNGKAINVSENMRSSQHKNNTLAAMFGAKPTRIND